MYNDTSREPNVFTIKGLPDGPPPEPRLNAPLNEMTVHINIDASTLDQLKSIASTARLLSEQIAALTVMVGIN